MIKRLMKPLVISSYRWAVRVAQAAPLLLARRVSNEAVRLGTDYGGWWVVDTPELHRGLVVSAGAGEDISFDIEVAQMFDADVVIVDPTSRAVTHVRDVLARDQPKPQCQFEEGGHQPIGAYDLSRIRPGQLRLVPVALWSDSNGIALYPPSNPSHVSYSATVSRHGGRRSAEPIRVESLRISELQAGDTRPIALVKLDIEGAEAEVLADMLATGVRPTQVLVELDELAHPTVRHVLRACRTVLRLRRTGYGLFRIEGLNYHFIAAPQR